MIGKYIGKAYQFFFFKLPQMLAPVELHGWYCNVLQCFFRGSTAALFIAMIAEPGSAET